MSCFTPEILTKSRDSCDVRIAAVEERLAGWKPYQMGMKLAEMLYEKEEDKEFFRNAPNQDNIKKDENFIRIIKTEKLIYNALGNPKTKASMFPILLAKYDELMGLSYDISGNMVLNDVMLEGEHLDYCKESLDQREFIKKVCFVGERERM